MDDKEQRIRERAHRIWEEEGRTDGAHDDHWRRAEAEHELTEQEANQVTAANNEAIKAFAGKNSGSKSAVESRPPSVSSAD